MLIIMEDFNFVIDITRTNNNISKGDWVILGYATTYELKEDDLQITKEALDAAQKDLAKYTTVLFNHNSDRPVGKIIETSVDDVGLLIKMVLSKEEEEIWKKVQDGTINKFSVQGRIEEAKPIGKDSSLQVTKIKLYEVSLVSVPGDVEAKTISWWISRSLKKQTSKKEMTDFISKLEDIAKRSPDDLRGDLSNLITALKVKNDFVSKLELLAGKTDGEEKEALEYAISHLKREKEVKYVEKEEPAEDSEEVAISPYDLSDQTKERPVFQFSADLKEEEITEEDGKFKFRKEILRKGKWYHWGAPGGVLEVNDELISNVIRNFKKKILDNVFVPLTHSNDPSKNTGDVVELIDTENGLDAVIEVKDATIAEKIRNGLIKGISASLDSNYFVSDKKNFVGPTLLHAALVAEPFIKGMNNFVPLSDELNKRTVVSLEDSQPDFYSLLEMIKESLSDIKSSVIKKEENSNMEKNIEEAVHKPGEPCEMPDGTEGKYKEKDGEMICVALEVKEENTDNKKVEKEKTEETDEKEKMRVKYEECLGEEVKKGKELGEAIKFCMSKLDIKESTSEGDLGDKPEAKSEETDGVAKEKVDLSDAKEEYDRYLKEGKIVPAQKEAFIKLFSSVKTINLGDEQVDSLGLIKSFLENSPKVIDFSEKGTGNGEVQNNEIVKEGTMPDEVRDFYSKSMGLSDETAQEAWKAAMDLKEEEDKNKESTIFN